MFIIEEKSIFNFAAEKGEYKLKNGRRVEYEVWRNQMVNSRNKGAAYERELAKAFRFYGYETRRGQQYCGANGDADVIGLPHIHIEAKRVERLNISDAMAQSKADAKEGEVPVVIHRKSNEKSLVTMELDDWIELYRSWEMSKEPETEKEHRIYKMFCEGCKDEKKCHEKCCYCEYVEGIRAWEGLL